MTPAPGNEQRVHWLYRPGSTRVLWWVAAVLLALALLAGVFVHVHASFAFDDWFGFNAVYGFLSCVAMVLFARVLGWLVKRPDDYYERPRNGAQRDGEPRA